VPHSNFWRKQSELHLTDSDKDDGMGAMNLHGDTLDAMRTTGYETIVVLVSRDANLSGILFNLIFSDLGVLVFTN